MRAAYLTLGLLSIYIPSCFAGILWTSEPLSLEQAGITNPAGYEIAQSIQPLYDTNQTIIVTLQAQPKQGVIIYFKPIYLKPPVNYDTVLTADIISSSSDIQMAVGILDGSWGKFASQNDITDGSLNFSLMMTGDSFLLGRRVYSLLQQTKTYISPVLQIITREHEWVRVNISNVRIGFVEKLYPEATPVPIPPFPTLITIGIPGLPAGAKPLEMVRIPAGSFRMGSPESEQERHPNESPLHQVTISKDFYLGKYEVTQAQWQAIMGNNPASGYGVGNNFPIYNVSWDDCQTFIQEINSLGLGIFRLPTEAEWEYACRAGTTTRFYWGDDLNYTQIDQYAWYGGNNSPAGTKEVGLKLPNAWGLFDMSGNVFEQCQNWYELYTGASQTDPQGLSSGIDRDARGGAWDNIAEVCRSAYRGYNSPSFKNMVHGLRLVMEIPR